MKDDKKRELNAEKPRQPLFTGDYRRDMSVSELEKAAEASYAIREALARMMKRDKDGQ